jgi:hypothetical protein
MGGTNAKRAPQVPLRAAAKAPVSVAAVQTSVPNGPQKKGPHFHEGPATFEKREYYALQCCAR